MSRQPCGRCGSLDTGPYGAHDYCASCLRRLCGECGSSGCCGATPAKSGFVSYAARLEDEIAASSAEKGGSR